MSANSCPNGMPTSAGNAHRDRSAPDDVREPTAAVVHLAVPRGTAKSGDVSSHDDASAQADASGGDVLVLTIDVAKTGITEVSAIEPDRSGPGADGCRRIDDEGTSVTCEEPRTHETEGDDVRGGVIGIDVAVDESVIIDRLDAAADALYEVDFARWSDAALSGHLDEVSLVLCRVDAQLSRLADAVRSRGFAITEVDLPLAS